MQTTTTTTKFTKPTLYGSPSNSTVMPFLMSDVSTATRNDVVVVVVVDVDGVVVNFGVDGDVRNDRVAVLVRNEDDDDKKASSCGCRCRWCCGVATKADTVDKNK